MPTLGFYYYITFFFFLRQKHIRNKAGGQLSIRNLGNKHIQVLIIMPHNENYHWISKTVQSIVSPRCFIKACKLIHLASAPLKRTADYLRSNGHNSEMWKSYVGCESPLQTEQIHTRRNRRNPDQSLSQQPRSMINLVPSIVPFPSATEKDRNVPVSSTLSDQITADKFLCRSTATYSFVYCEEFISIVNVPAHNDFLTLQIFMQNYSLHWIVCFLSEMKNSVPEKISGSSSSLWLSTKTCISSWNLFG